MARSSEPRLVLLRDPAGPARPDLLAAREEEGRALRLLDRVEGSARAVMEELDSARLAAALARQVGMALAADRAWVAVTDDHAVLHHSAWVLGERAEAAEGDPELALLFALSRRSQELRLHDPEETIPGWGGRLADLGWRNGLGVPILDHRGRSLGALLVGDRRDGAPFSPTDQRLVETLALQAAVGLERALLLDQLSDWTRGLEALLSFSAAVNQQLGPPALVEHLVEHATRFLKAEGGRAGLTVAAPEAEGAPVMESRAYFRAGAWKVEPRRWAPGDGLPGFMLDNQFPYLTDSYARDRLAEPALVAEGVRSAVCVPIKGSNQAMMGFFELHRGTRQQAFSWQDATFLESLANTTAVAIENAELISALEAKSEQIRALSAHNVNCLEEERRHIARELHDEAGQALVGVKLGLQVMARLVPGEMPALREQIDSLRSQVNDATNQIKDLARRLRPPTLDQLGLEVALRQLVAEYGAVTDLSVRGAIGPLGGRPPQPVETALYRIAQEALTNVAMHAKAQRARLDLRAGKSFICLEVWDDGAGFVPESITAGLGLLGMRERVGMLRGELRIASGPGLGTSIRVEIPWERRHP